MDVKLSIERDLAVRAPVENADFLFVDIASTLRRFPKLAELHALGANEYRWRMKTIGSRAARVAYDAEFHVKTQIDRNARSLCWTPVPESGNAQLAAELFVVSDKPGCRLILKLSGQLRDVPVPLVYRPMAGPFIRGKFLRLVDDFLDGIRASMVEADSRQTAVGG